MLNNEYLGDIIMEFIGILLYGIIPYIREPIVWNCWYNLRVYISQGN